MPNGISQAGERWRGARRRLVALAVVVGLFAGALLVSRAVLRAASAGVEIGDPGTTPRLLVGVLALQVLGFGGAAALFLWTRCREWRTYLRLRELSAWTVFYGTAVGLALMVVAAVATGLFTLLDVEPAESAAGQATDPAFYLVLFAVSTFVAVPLEELFFRGVVQRNLEERFHAAVAIAVASLLFMLVHTGVNVGTGGETIALGMFFTFGVVLGTGYHLTENLFVPLIGHVVFNGVQILLRAVEVAA